MKTNILILALGIMLAISLFTACEQNELLEVTKEEVTSNKPLAMPDKAEVQAEALDVIQISDEIETRGASVLIYSTTSSVSANGWKHFGYSKSSLAGYKLKAVITPIGGDPDLYVYGYQSGKAAPWRYLRKSAMAGVDVSTLAGSDLNVSENYGYFSVYGYTAATFRIQIYREDICATEDCVPMDASKIIAVREGSQYVIKDGISRKFMAPNDAEAKLIVKVLTHYNIDKSCFVGRPGASFFYLTQKGKAPEGAMAGEDCVNFNPNSIEVKRVNGRWKIVDGNHSMFDFDQKEDEAREAFCIIKKYGFTKSCFVGRPGPSLQYMRK